jgi:single-stranded DNA-specific DHH superfamily exonuclease
VDDETKEIRWEGSGRGCSGSNFEDFKGFLNQSGYINWAEGHANAFGASFNDAVVNDFITYSNFQLKDIDFSPCYKVDFIFDANNFSSFDILEIANLKSIWGQGIDEPYIAIENIKVTSKNLYLMKSNTLKIVLPNGMSLIKFRVSDEEYKALYSELGCVTINVVGTCERNVYNGIISPQVTIENYEIVSKSEYYF